MSAPSLAEPAMIGAWRRPGVCAAVIGIGLIMFGLIFHTEVVAAINTWISSTAYNHCFLVLPIVAYLIWDRRSTLHGATAEPVPLAALAGIPLALGWLAAERLGIMEGRQLAAMSFVELLLFAVLGWRLFWLLSGPLLYLYFLVPFGDFITPALQDFTTEFVRYGANIVGIPAYIDHYTIEIPEGTFYIAEACAGLRFLIASIAFGALYALLMYRSPIRRAVFIVASIIVPVVANGFRALGIVALGHILGSAEAAAADHVLYGWIFFSLVILMLIAIGLPFREDHVTRESQTMPDAARRAPAGWRDALVAGGVVVVLAAVSPALAMALGQADSGESGAVSTLDLGPGCTVGAAIPPPAVTVRGQLTSHRVTCGELALDVRVDLLPRHSTAAPLVADRRWLTNIPTTDDIEFRWLPQPPGAARIWRLVQVPQRGPFVAFVALIDGRPVPPALPMRIHMAWSSIIGAHVAPAVVTVTPAVDWRKTGPEARETLQNRLGLLLSQPAVLAQLRRLGAEK